MTGLERLIQDPSRLGAAGRVGLLTHPAGLTRDFVPAAVALQRAGVRLERLYGPEHGVDGSGHAGEAPDLDSDTASGLPAHSLYHKTLPEITELLRQVDTLLIDLQDVGVRFYTYISSLWQVLEASREAGIRVVVLDRPNPIGFGLEGPVLRPEFRSFVGIAEFPLRHGLTIGEFGHWAAEVLDAQVEVIETALASYGPGGLPWVPPSPNLPDLENVLLYPGTCLIEATEASEGRGTALPFRWAGAPGIDAHALAARLNRANLGNVHFRPAYYQPTHSKHADTPCAGVQVHLTGPLPRALPVGLALVGALHEQGVELKTDWLQKLVGLPAGEIPLAPETALEVCAQWEQQAQAFAHERFAPHWLYARD